MFSGESRLILAKIVRIIPIMNVVMYKPTATHIDLLISIFLLGVIGLNSLLVYLFYEKALV